MDNAQMLEEIRKMLDTVEAKVMTLLEDNLALEKENADLLKDNQILRNYVDNESVSKGALRNLLGENPDGRWVGDWVKDDTIGDWVKDDTIGEKL